MKSIFGARQGGLTLVELMVVLTIVVVLLSATLPVFTTLRHRVSLHSETSRLLHSLQFARSEAVNRNVAVTLCPAAVSSTANARCGGLLTGGWLVFANPARDAQFSTQDDFLLRRFVALPQGYSITDRAGRQDFNATITFLPDGSSHRNLTLMLCAPAAVSLPSRSIVMNRLGRARVADAWGECPSEAT